MEGIPPVRSGLITPDLVDDPVGRNHLIAMDQQEGEESALFVGPQIERRLVPPNL